MVRGSNPHTQGETAVKRPAPYIMGMLDTKLEGSSREMEAKDEAVDCAWNMTSSKFIIRRLEEETGNGDDDVNGEENVGCRLVALEV